MSFGDAIFELGFQLMVWAAILALSGLAAQAAFGLWWLGPVLLGVLVASLWRFTRQDRARRQAERGDPSE